MTRMIIIRHGQSEGNLTRRFWGQFDGPLTDIGRRQAEMTAGYLKNWHIDAAVASDLSRAYETGRIIAAPHGLEVVPVRGLREINAGEWETKTFEELPVLYPEDFGCWRSDVANSRPTGGESVRELDERINNTLWKLAAEYDGKTLLIATHATPIRTQICRWKGMPIEEMQNIDWIPNASVTIVDYDTSDHTTHLSVLGEAGFMGELSTNLPKNV